MSLALKARQKAKRKGGGAKEKVFGCDLLEHLQQSGKDVPQVLRSCTEFVEQHGVVDGIYRLSGVSSNIQRLRQEFDGERSPDLQKDVYLQDIHCVSSLCKAYFRELPNPLLTYRLYDRFADAVATQMEEARLVKIKEVLKELPPPHYRTLEFLMRHLLRMASHSRTTNMHARNLAIVWAPNLLRSRDIEATGFNGTAAFMEVRVQSIVVEFILTHVEQLFGDAPLCGGDASRCSRLFPADGSGSCNIPAALSQGDGPPPIRPYHTIIELSEHRRKGSLKAKKWKSIFHLGRSDAKRKLGKAEEKEKCGKLSLRPAKSMDSLSSVPYSSDADDPPRLSTTHVMKAAPQRRESFDTCSSLPPTGPFPALEESPEEKLTAMEEPRGPESESESSTKSEPTTPRPGRVAALGARSRAEKCAGLHISGPFSVTVPLHITSNLSRLTRGQQCPALAQHGAGGSPPPTRHPTKEHNPPRANAEEDARLSLELRDSFAFLDCQDAWMEHGDGDTARAATGHGDLGDSEGDTAIEEGMESGFMNPGEPPAEQPASYLSIEECMDEEMFYMAPSGSDTEDPPGDTDSDDMFLSAHDELSPLAADPETPPSSVDMGEGGAELQDGSPAPQPCPAEEAPGDLEDPCGDTAEEGGWILEQEGGGGGDGEGGDGWSRTQLGIQGEDGAAAEVMAAGGEEDGGAKQSGEGDPQPSEGSALPEGPLQEHNEPPLPQGSVPEAPPAPMAAQGDPPTPMVAQGDPPTPMTVQGDPANPMVAQGDPATPMTVPEVPPTPLAIKADTDPPPEAAPPPMGSP
ncbi:rho GTPase-activating protein 30 [Excalfactoria chinensis]|uniref:rho GTPase-activating protein 30 n=1 Tax=Excalfactoria chinensis TaxID=46218 RepID=UPI003B3A4CFD